MNRPENFCRTILPEVSRTFALNIPVLPGPLDLAVTVAYLLCRIADTLEDETQGEVANRAPLLEEFARLCSLPQGWREATDIFVDTALPNFRAAAPRSEVELVRGTPLVLEALSELSPGMRPLIVRCVREMTVGMHQVLKWGEKNGSVLGLEDLEQTLTYCYYVAGTVGEMLTGLFCDYSPGVEKVSKTLMSLAPAFGRALQLTNILKDIREDFDRGICWLPKTEMVKHGLESKDLIQPARRIEAVALLDDLIQVAKRETDWALEYALTVPGEETGIRLFCLWPLFLAVATLNKLKGNPQVFEPDPVKISRELVMKIVNATQQNVDQDPRLRTLYADLGAKLNLGHQGSTRVA